MRFRQAAAETEREVRVAIHHAEATLKRLRDFGLQARLGPVPAHYDTAYFLVAPNTSHEPWPDIPRYCGHGTFLAVAPARPIEEGALYWLIPPPQTGGRHWPLPPGNPSKAPRLRPALLPREPLPPFIPDPRNATHVAT